MSNEGVCKTAPAARGLLKTSTLAILVFCAPLVVLTVPYSTLPTYPHLVVLVVKVLRLPVYPDPVEAGVVRIGRAEGVGAHQRYRLVRIKSKLVGEEVHDAIIVKERRGEALVVRGVRGGAAILSIF